MKELRTIKSKRNRFWDFVFILMLLFAWALFAFNTNNPDYIIYSDWYIHPTKSGGVFNRFEPGFASLMVICQILGFSYQQFLMILSGIGFILIAISLKKYCRYPTMALFLYILYPFMFDIVQIRNFIAETIVLFALKYLKECNKKNLIRYILFCVLATMFHKTAIFYFIFLVAYVQDFKKSIRIIVGLTIVMSLVSLALPNIINMIALSVSHEIYLEQGSTIAKIVGYGLFGVLAIVLMYFTHSYKTKEYDENDYISRLIPVLLLCCIAIAISSQAYRLFRNMAIIVYIVFLNDGLRFVKSKVGITSTRFMNSVYAISFSLFFYVRQISPWSSMYERLTKVIIENNSLFGGH